MDAGSSRAGARHGASAPDSGAIGKHGSIAVIERFIRSIKSQCTRRIVVPFRLDQMRRDLSSYAVWYNEHRPHTGLAGQTPAEVYFGWPPAREAPRYEPRARWLRDARRRKGRPGVRLELVLRHLDGRRHLPIVELKLAA